MVQKKTDMRATRSRQYLTNALISMMGKKSLEKITVNDIVTEAKVARTTFYAQFEDKQHFIDCVIEDKFAELRDIVKPHKQGADIIEESTTSYIKYFEAFRENAEFFKAFLGPNGMPGFTTRLIENGVKAYTEYFKMAPDDIFPIPKKYVILYIVTGNIGLGQEWMAGDFKESPEYMANIQAKLTIGGLLKGLGVADAVSLPT